jgi:hypothetical protein
VLIFENLNDKQNAQTALLKAQRIKQFADSHRLELNANAVNDYNSLKRKLQQ